MISLFTIWGKVEPLIFLIQLAFKLRNRGQSRMTLNQFDHEFEECFAEINTYLSNFELPHPLPGSKESYLKLIKTEFTQRNNLYTFCDGEIQLWLLKAADLPKRKRINVFLRKVYFFTKGYPKILNSLLIKERFLRFFKNKYTYFHYLSITGWPNKNYLTLIDEVERITEINPRLFERFEIPKNVDLQESKPYISRAIDNVLAKGKISEKSILNLATSEKLVFVQKYGEGFTSTYSDQKKERSRVKLDIEKWQSSKAKQAPKMLEKAKSRLSEINSNWVRAPLGLSLEKTGFQKLFNKLDGVYVLPLSMIPEKYQKEPELYIKEVVLKEAKRYLDEINDTDIDYVTEISNVLKYIMIIHIIPVNQLKIYTQERNLEISSPILSRMLLTSYLSLDDTKMSSMYINDIVRNVDLKTLLKSNKTGEYFNTNFESLKLILWADYQLDIYKPFSLSTLNENQINDISQKLHALDNSVALRFIRKQVSDMVDFYSNLNKELNEIKI